MSQDDKGVALSEREAFEVWAESEGYPIDRHELGDDQYAVSLTECVWDAWQARASSSQDVQYAKMPDAPYAPIPVQGVALSERDAFEKVWLYDEGAIPGCIALERDPAGDYRDLDTNSAWESWQLACKWQRCAISRTSSSRAEEPECKTCGGRGQVNCSERIGESDFHEWEEDCPVCGGAGTAPAHVQAIQARCEAAQSDLHKMRLEAGARSLFASLRAEDDHNPVEAIGVEFAMAENSDDPRAVDTLVEALDCTFRTHGLTLVPVEESSSRAEVEIPDGYALVPKEPTDDMVKAALADPCWDNMNPPPKTAYKAMLAAAEAPNGDQS